MTTINNEQCFDFRMHSQQCAPNCPGKAVISFGGESNIGHLPDRTKKGGAIHLALHLHRIRAESIHADLFSTCHHAQALIWVCQSLVKPAPRCALGFVPLVLNAQPALLSHSSTMDRQPKGIVKVDLHKILARGQIEAVAHCNAHPRRLAQPAAARHSKHAWALKLPPASTAATAPHPAAG